MFIYDMTESKYANFDYDLSIKILNLLKGGYPARLKRVLIVTAPLWFKGPFKILRLFVKEKLRDRVYTVSVSELVTYVPRSSLPLNLAGTSPPCHGVWLDFCDKCATQQHPDPATYFTPQPIESSTATQPTHQNKTSPSRSPSSELDTDTDASSHTVNEKQDREKKEKEEAEMADKEKRDKDTNKGPKISPSTRKRGSASISSADECVASQTVTDEMPRKKRPPSSGSNILDDSIHMPDTAGLNVQQLLSRVNSLKRKGLVGEYGSIKMEQPTGTFVTSKLKVNLPKNRYTDVLCYDHSRVTLPTSENASDNESTTDYINANFVDGYMQKHGYISTQGPLPKTFVDFWRMVWHNQTRVIVMTTKTFERSRMKCGQYWPNEEETDEQFEEFVVNNTGVIQGEDYTETGLLVHNSVTGENRHITHLQFTSWPDYGVPPAAPFLDFLFRVRDVQEAATKVMGKEWKGHPLGPPIIVHCSAGIGRTGTFITVDVCLRRLEDVGTVDVRETVRRIRSQRAFSIQMPDQYVFCHQAVIEHAMRQGLINGIQHISLDDSDSDDL